MKIRKKYLQSILLVCVCCVFLNSTFFALKEEPENEQEEMIQRDLSLNLGNGTCLWLVVFVCHIIPFSIMRMPNANDLTLVLATSGSRLLMISQKTLISIKLSLLVFPPETKD
jgi:hypothetical protein